MNRYRIEYIIVEEPFWAEAKEVYIDASDFDEIMNQIGQQEEQKFYILRIWIGNDSGYSLMYRSEIEGSHKQ